MYLRNEESYIILAWAAINRKLVLVPSQESFYSHNWLSKYDSQNLQGVPGLHSVSHTYVHTGTYVSLPVSNNVWQLFLSNISGWVHTTK